MPSYCTDVWYVVLQFLLVIACLYLRVKLLVYDPCLSLLFYFSYAYPTCLRIKCLVIVVVVVYFSYSFFSKLGALHLMCM
jgi:hypothetical protein